MLHISLYKQSTYLFTFLSTSTALEMELLTTADKGPTVENSRLFVLLGVVILYIYIFFSALYLFNLYFIFSLLGNKSLIF